MLLGAVLAAWLLAGAVEAAVVVVHNRTDRAVEFSLGPMWGGTVHHYTVGPAGLASVQVPGPAQVEFLSDRASVRRSVEPDTLHEFLRDGEKVDLRPVLFSTSPPRQTPAAGPRGLVVVPVKLLADEANPATRALWERRLRQQLEMASQRTEACCGVRFQAAAVDSWRADAPRDDPARLLDEFSNVKPQPGWLAVGVLSGMKGAGSHEAGHAPQPMFSHLLLPEAGRDFSRDDQLRALVRGLGHYLGAVHSPEPGSVMRATPVRGRVLNITFDALNTLVMNLWAEEIGAHGPRAAEAMAGDSRRYLAAIYLDVATHLPGDRQPLGYAELLRAPVPPPGRYLGQWIDGSRLAAARVAGWHHAAASPTLADRELFDRQRPIRWLLDSTLPEAPPAESWLEFVGGDCLPGRVVGFSDGTESPSDRLPPHLTVQPCCPLDLPGSSARASVRVILPWLRRIVWQRVTQGYQPRTLFFPDGRRLEFRSVRFSSRAVQLLRDEGIVEVPMSEAAELHLAPRDPWEVHFEQLAALAPGDEARLVRVETVSGLRATSSTQRFDARGSADRPASWYHLVQPAWSLEPFWLAHEAIRLREYFAASEVPLSRITPSRSLQQSDLGGGWPEQFDRNVQGGLLESGGKLAAWGFGVHARSELEFPLPAAARAFRTRLGLDELAGDGGCVRASVAVEPGGTLFASGLVRGSEQTLDSEWLPLDGKQKQSVAGTLRVPSAFHGTRSVPGTLPATGNAPFVVPPLGGSSPGFRLKPVLRTSATSSRAQGTLDGKPGRLVLRVEPAWREGPPGTDPLDIRDIFDWLEPIIELDPQQVETELARRGPGLVAAWQNWRVTTGDAPLARLITYRDERAARDPSYRLLVCPGNERLHVRGKLLPRPGKDQLLVAVSRPPPIPVSQLEVRVEGRSLGRFEVPVRDTVAAAPIVVSLAPYRGRSIAVELIQHPSNEKSMVEWRAISLVGHQSGGPVGGGSREREDAERPNLKSKI